MRDRTFVLIKPDGVRRKLTEEIKRRLLQGTGGKIVAEKEIAAVSEELAMKHYYDLGERRGEVVKRRMVNFLVSGPVRALVLEGEGIVAKVRAVVGATEPISAARGTIRGDLASDSYLQADKEDRAVENLVHASDSPKEAEREIRLWFPELE